VRLRCDGRRGIHTGFVRDLSRGGLFIRLVDPEPAGRRLGFELWLPGRRSPARGIAEVAWQRPSYEGPGRPPGMALRFVALEAEGIALLASLLPGGEGPAVEVLPPPQLPVLARREEREVPPPEPEPPVPELGEDEPPTPMEPLFAEAFAEPMIFEPPPPLPMPAVVPALVEEPTSGAGAGRLRWGSAAAGIAAAAGLATLVVVGAAQRGGERERSTEIERPGGVAIMAPPPGPVAAAGAPSRPAPGSVLEPVTEPSVVSAPLPASPARHLTGLSWEPLAGGGTRVVVSLDGALEAGRWRTSRIGGDTPRLVVRLLGIVDGAPRVPWEPATAEVARIRAGRHDGAEGGEVHLVLDLAGAAVMLAGATAEGSELRLDLEGGQGAPSSAP
jgi:hypothetical protein